MYGIKRIRVRSYERGLLFRNGEFVRVLGQGVYWFAFVSGTLRVDIVSRRSPWLVHDQLDLIVQSGALAGEAVVLDLKDRQRALVWVDDRFERVLGPGLYALWTGLRGVRAEVIDIDGVRFEHRELETILRSAGTGDIVESTTVDQGYAGVLLRNGEYQAVLKPGVYAFWKGFGRLQVLNVDMRESVLDVAGQEIMTGDKVTLRMNAVIGYRITDARRFVAAVDDGRQALYREAQLALRALIGTKVLDDFLGEKDVVSDVLKETLKAKAAEYGIEVVGAGIRDVILPGEMKELMNKVTEAKKAAEANLIARREETAAMRSQANTARLLESNPTLMRLRELEIAAEVAKSAKLSIVAGQKSITESVLNVV